MISSAEVHAEAMSAVAQLTCVNRILNRRLAALQRELAELRGEQLIEDLSQSSPERMPPGYDHEVEGPDT